MTATRLSAVTDIHPLQQSERHESQAKSPSRTVLALLIFVLLALSALAQGPSYPYSVSLPFTASTGTITGYNMYRVSVASTATSCPASGYSKLNSSPFTATTYTDSNPLQGFYCYGATALDGSQESGLSNLAGPVSIPPPPPTNLGFTLASNKNANVQFAWTQSVGNDLQANTLYCSVNPSKPMTKRWSGKLSTQHSLALLSGTHKCGVTVTAQLESGLSNIVTVSVP